MNENNNFNLIRLIAAAEVVYMHAAGWLHLPQIRTTWFLADILPGVTIFFVVSGFLVTRSFMASANVRDYFGRRALRIYPGLAANLLFIVVLLGTTGSLPLASLATTQFWQWLATSVVMGSDFYGNYFMNASPFTFVDTFYKGFPSGVLWTINVELGFYLLVPLLFWRQIRESAWLWAVILTFAVASLAFASLLSSRMTTAPGDNWTSILFCSPAPYFWIFLLGASASVCWDKIKGAFEGKFLIWLGAYLALTFVDLYGFGIETIDMNHYATAFTIPRIIALAGMVLSFAHSFAFLGKPVRKIDISYGLYLYHMPVVATLVALGYDKSAVLWLIVYGAAAIIATLSWFLIEKPALKLKGRLTSHRNELTLQSV